MPLHDNKKVATLVNLTLDAIRQADEARQRLHAIRQKVISEGLAAKIPAGIASDLNNFVTGLNALGAPALITKIAPYEVPTHRNKAIGGIS